MAQELGQIIQELDAAYNPSRQAINDRINGLQGAESADLAGLEAQKNQSFDDITNGARSRGIGFSGIPLQEQAKYTASSFLPAVAKVKQQYVANRGSLVDALNQMNMDQHKTAMGLRETQMDRDWRAAEAEKERAAARASAAASNADWSSFLGGGAQQTPKAAPNQAPKTDPAQQKAYDFVMATAKKGDLAIVSDFRAAKAYYEKTGNPNDLIKLQIYKQKFPQLLGNATWKDPGMKGLYF